MLSLFCDIFREPVCVFYRLWFRAKSILLFQSWRIFVQVTRRIIVIFEILLLKIQ